MKKIMVISDGRNTGQALIQQLKGLFGNKVSAENLLLKELPGKSFDSDLVIYTSGYVKTKGSVHVDPKIRNIVANRVINHRNIQELISLQTGLDVLFVNDGYESTNEAVGQLEELGLDHVKYHKYYPGVDEYPKLGVIVTPGEIQLAPYIPHKMIDLGTRILGLSTIFEIISILGIDDGKTHLLVSEYLKDIVEISKSIDEKRKESQANKEILESIINSLDSGIGFIDNLGKLRIHNKKFKQMLDLKRHDIAGMDVSEIEMFNSIGQLKEGSSILNVGNRTMKMDLIEVDFSQKKGYLSTLKYTNQELKNTASGEVFKSKQNMHNFDDYYTVEPSVRAVLNRAKKYAKTEGTILIYGENGTGKEILAQGIHQNSSRRDKVFIPINIAAISPSLVESELFGYEEGTFTGALKGGRIGLFQMADGGTLFIDEIGDTPLEVQAKLLRVLEEKKIRKVGGSDEIKVDVRIIAATNKNLLQLVDQGKFRLDLFFRLNTLPLNTIPLRERPKDIDFLLRMFINLNLKTGAIANLEDFFTPESLRILRDYSWIGNVRELRNLAEYLCLIHSGSLIQPSDLHSHILSESKTSGAAPDSKGWILSTIARMGEAPIGRIRLARIAEEEAAEIGEGKLRRLIQELKEEGLVEVENKIGIKLTEKGKTKIMNGYIQP